MKINPDFIKQTIGEQRVVMAVGETTKTFNGILYLNKTSELLWDALQEEKTEADLAELLVSTYHIELSQAQNDVKEFIGTLQQVSAIKD